MDFTTILIGQKRQQIRLKAKVKYDMFNIYPELNFIKKNNLFTIDEGNLFFDFIGDQGPLEFMSNTFKLLLENNNVKGLDFFPIKVENCDKDYFGFVVKNEINSFCDFDENGDRIYGSFKVDLESWDGSDIFRLKDCGATVCTLKVKELIEKAKITNIEFEDLSKY